jgi:Fe(3+) dicitrate transport protein
MKTIALFVVFFCCFFSTFSQDKTRIGCVKNERTLERIAYAQIHHKKNVYYSNDKGEFPLIAEQATDTFTVQAMNYEQQIVLLSKQDTVFTDTLFIYLKESNYTYGNEVLVKGQYEGFDMRLLPTISGTRINPPGRVESIRIDENTASRSTGNPRQIFAKIPGLNIWESGNSGIQLGIGGRGLSPNRAANFNTRQNGYDISADALGYPESYYTPPFEALKGIEIIRGAASLQYGTQFGGLLNFAFKAPASSTPFEFTSRNTGGSFGYFATFNRISGRYKRFEYQAYYQYKRGDGWRKQSWYNQHQGFAQLGFYISESAKIRLEYTHMSYLTQQAGGLTDLQFQTNPKQVNRYRNWFRVNWNILALNFDKEWKKSHFNFRAFGMLSNRQSLGFLGKISQSDNGGNRQIINGDFKNTGAEVRYLRRFSMGKEKSQHAALLFGARFYKGQTTSQQGLASADSSANFKFLHPDQPENSSYQFPSSNFSLFSEAVFVLNSKWVITPGLRYEYIYSSSKGYYNQFILWPLDPSDTLSVVHNVEGSAIKRSFLIGGIGVAYKANNKLEVYANANQNYRAINFNDIKISNPNLIVDAHMKDEKGFTSELGIKGIVNNYFMYDVGAFYIWYGNKIGLAPVGTQKERTNIGNARNTGIEMFMEFDFLKKFMPHKNLGLSLWINAAYINAIYVSSKEAAFVHKQVEYVSPFIFRTGIKFGYKKLQTQLQFSYNAAQFTDATNAEIPSGDALIGKIPSYYVLDFSASYQFKKWFGLELSINNLSNHMYFTRRATGYPGPGIIPSNGIGFFLTLAFKIAAK